MFPFEKTCRTCMKSNVSLINLFRPLKIEENCSLNLADVLMLTNTLEVSVEDGLPQNVCEECAKVLQTIYSFRRKAQKAETELKILCVSHMKDEIDFAYKEEVEYTNPYKYLEYSNHNIEARTYICDICNKQFHKHKKFLNHLASHENRKYKCTTCNKSFHKQSSLNKHISKHIEVTDCGNPDELSANAIDIDVKLEDINDLYKCPECNLVFETQSCLLDHMKEHVASSAIYVCDICKKNFYLETVFKHHMEEHSKPQTNPNQCMKCLVNFVSTESLLQHIDICNPNREVKLENYNEYEYLDSDVIFKDKSYLDNLENQEEDKRKKIFKCDNCSKSFSLKTLLRRHMRLHSTSKPFQCTKCSKCYTRQDQLAAHMRIHDGYKPYACPHCSKAFSQLCSLKDHVRTHTGETPFLCSQCGKGFANSSNLRQHLRRHTGVKPFACSLCPKTFSTKGQMKQHIDTHTGVHPYKCSVCGASFTKPNSLKKHKLIHLGVRPFACDTCNMRFTCKDHLTRHKRIHTGERPYRCTHCTRTFTQSNDLNKHVRAHLGQNIYQCTVCQAKFRLMRELKSHYPVHYINDQGESQSEPVKKDKQTDGQITITFNRNVLDKDSLGDITINITPDKITN
ncbi:gastrula zinc finger protein XlCGF57.1-like isoform X1 [Danaus plexippus]|uniref:gastrula zinc finger protein XlCGF57.1-like isoform X1 n=1 Tax=Danaus plexippus TaxID=13037 RepID=UPI002AB2B820|nr:gastrula zinc finger protein XlCGF57.1-like isoform X1 [Danaus plexippus]